MSGLSKLAHGAGHVVWLLVQYENYASNFVPPKYKGIVSAVVGLVQAIHGYYLAKQVHNG